MTAGSAAATGGLAIAVGLAASGLSLEQLWWDYVSIGGCHPPAELADYMAGRSSWSRYQHDVAAQALNDHFLDHGLDHVVAYSDEM